MGLVGGSEPGGWRSALVQLHRDVETGAASTERVRELRDELIRRQVRRGQSQRSLAALLGVSHQRIAQIVREGGGESDDSTSQVS